MGNSYATTPTQITPLNTFLSDNKKTKLAEQINRRIKDTNKYLVIPAELIREKLHEALLILAEFKEAYYTVVCNGYEYPLYYYSEKLYPGGISNKIVIAKIDMDIIEKLSITKDISDDMKLLDEEIYKGKMKSTAVSYVSVNSQDEDKYNKFYTNFHLNWRPLGYEVRYVKNREEGWLSDVLRSRKLVFEDAKIALIICHPRHKEHLGIVYELPEEDKKRIFMKRLGLDIETEGEEGAVQKETA